VAAEMEEIFPTSRSGITTHSLIVLYTGLGWVKWRAFVNTVMNLQLKKVNNCQLLKAEFVSWQ
jgi:hypothetical protein